MPTTIRHAAARLCLGGERIKWREQTRFFQLSHLTRGLGCILALLWKASDSGADQERMSSGRAQAELSVKGAW